jgi:excisionase family DNA binding protein
MEPTTVAKQQFLSPADFARLSGLSLSTVQRYLRDGKIPYLQPAGRRGRILIPLQAFERAVHDVNALEVGASADESSTTSSSSDEPRLPGPRPKWMR